MRVRLQLVVLSILTVCGACASRPANPGPTDAFRITIENPTDDMIQLFFQGENGTRRRLGTVVPRSVATLQAPLVHYGPGYFIARRLGQPEPAAGVGPRVNPPDLSGVGITITLHSFSGFDTWTVRR